MAITASQIQFRASGGATIIPSGRLNNLFGNAYTNAGPAYRWVEVWQNNTDFTLTAVKAWLTIDPRGALIAIAYDNVNGVIDQSFGFTAQVDPGALSYVSPTSKGTGLTLANMGSGTKLRISVRRTMVNPTPASPETNRLWVGGTSPI